MPVFDTIKNLQLYIQNVTIPQIADVVETEVKNELNKQVEKTVYKDAFVGVNDEFYSHSFGLRDSAMADIMSIGNNLVGKGLFLDIYLNPKSSYYSEDGTENVTSWIVELLNDGHGNGTPNKGGYYKGKAINYKGRGFFELTYQNLIKSGELKKTIKNRLKQLGYQISR